MGGWIGKWEMEGQAVHAVDLDGKEAVSVGLARELVELDPEGTLGLSAVSVAGVLLRLLTARVYQFPRLGDELENLFEAEYLPEQHEKRRRERELEHSEQMQLYFEELLSRLPPIQVRPVQTLPFGVGWLSVLGGLPRGVPWPDPEITLPDRALSRLLQGKGYSLRVQEQAMKALSWSRRELWLRVKAGQEPMVLELLRQQEDERHAEELRAALSRCATPSRSVGHPRASRKAKGRKGRG